MCTDPRDRDDDEGHGGDFVTDALDTVADMFNTVTHLNTDDEE